MVAKDSRESLNSLLSKMRPILLAAKIPPKQINIRAGRHRITSCNKTFDWLHDLYMSSEYNDVFNIWKLVPAETWRRYKLYEIEGLREQEILENAGKRLLKKWRSGRPKLLGPDRKRDSEISNERKADTCAP